MTANDLVDEARPESWVWSSLSFIWHLLKRDQRFHADIPGLILHGLHRGIALDVRTALDPAISIALASKKDLTRPDADVHVFGATRCWGEWTWPVARRCVARV